MKLKIILDPTKEEEILIHAKEITPKIEKIKSIIEEDFYITGYKKDIVKKINFEDIIAIFTRDSKIYVSTNEDEFIIKSRLYQIEEYLDDSFLKINQGCIVNVYAIKEFTSSFNASLKVVMNNGFSDYISRRELKNVKRRLSLWTTKLWKRFYYVVLYLVD